MPDEPCLKRKAEDVASDTILPELSSPSDLKQVKSEPNSPDPDSWEEAKIIAAGKVALKLTFPEENEDKMYAAGTGTGAGSVIADGAMFRAIIKSGDAGAIIGRGGENIKRLRSQYNVTISVPDSNSPERVLQIGGDIDNVCKVIMEIIPVLDDYKHHTNLDFEAEMRMLVLAVYVGAIMGTGGANIKALRESTGANIKVYEDCCPGSNERVFRITSKPATLTEVVNKILNAVRSAPDLKPKDGIAKLYDPNFSENVGGSSRMGPPPRMSRGMGSPPHNSMYEPTSPGTHGRGFGGTAPNYDPGMTPDFLAGPPIPADPNEETKTVKVSIRNEDAGAVIGVRGSTINRVRERSGATIKIESQASVSQDAGGGARPHRIITITGTEQQIQFAQYLMQQSVKADQARMSRGGPQGDMPGMPSSGPAMQSGGRRR